MVKRMGRLNVAQALILGFSDAAGPLAAQLFNSMEVTVKVRITQLELNVWCSSLVI